jgi:dTDP-4-amino-4,6-dideoxygalactose transaminase
MIKVNNLPYFQPFIGNEEIEAVVDTLKSGWLINGPKVAKFEDAICQYTDAPNVVCVASGTAALHLSLIALGIGDGDEVITSPFTFAATGNAIIHTGAKPVFVDISRDTYNIDPEKIEDAIGIRTKAILPVHYAGQPCNMDVIMSIAKKHNLYVIEDATHALGSEYKGEKIGTIGDATCFSFNAIKSITTGEGGAVTARDEKIIDKIKLLRWQGIRNDPWKRSSITSIRGSWYYEIEVCGWKYGMTDLAASLGIIQIKKLEQFTATRIEYARLYRKEFNGIEGIINPYEVPDSKHVYHLYPILLKRYNRDTFFQNMAENGIACSVHYIPLHLHPFYRNTYGYKDGAFPNAEWVYKHEISLPIYPKMHEDDVWRVINTVKDIIQKTPK